MKRVLMQLPLVFLLAIITGCAGKVLDLESSKQLKSGKIAALIHISDPSIEYNQMVYKVLWNETRTQRSAFNAIWDADSDLTQRMVKKMNAINLKAKQASDLISHAKYNDLIDAINLTTDAENSAVPLILDPEIITSFKASGIDYLMAVRSYHFTIPTTTTLNSAGLLALPSRLIIYDLHKKSEIYSDIFPLAAHVKWGDSPRNLESNNLDLLKKSANAIIDKGVSEQLVRVLGM